MIEVVVLWVLSTIAAYYAGSKIGAAAMRLLEVGG